MFQAIGHQKQKDFLERSLQQGTLSHAYLFAGPSEIGKRTIALEFAAAIAGIDPEKSENHPDIIRADATELPVAEMRDLLRMLSLAPFSAAKKIAIIDNFEHAGREASNALLKTLEEPNASTIIILITENHKALLPTIVSRVQLLTFARLSGYERFGGRVGRARRYEADPDYRTAFDAALKQYAELSVQSKGSRLLAIKALAENEDAQLCEILSVWLDAEYESFAADPKRYRNITALSSALSAMNINANRKLILQKAFLELA